MSTTYVSSAAPAREAHSPGFPAEIPPTPEERQRELTAILAVGLLRLQVRPELAPGASDTGAQGSSQPVTACSHAAQERLIRVSPENSK